MADPTNIGSTGFTEIESRDRWTTNQGWVKVRTWTGLITQVDAFCRTSLPAGYVSLDITRSSPMAMVVSEYPLAGEPGDTQAYNPDPITLAWQLVSSREEASIWSLPKVIEALNKTVTEIQRGPLTRWINDCITSGLGADKAFPKTGWPPAPAVSTMPNRTTAPFNTLTQTVFNNHIFADLYERLTLNRDTYPISRYVLRKVQTIGNYSQLRASHANVLRMFTLAQLRANEPTLSQDVQVEITNAGLTTYYWLKNPPQSEPVQNGRKQMTVEYEAFACYDKWIHKSITDPADPIIEPIETKKTVR